MASCQGLVSRDDYMPETFAANRRILPISFQASNCSPIFDLSNRWLGGSSGRGRTRYMVCKAVGAEGYRPQLNALIKTSGYHTFFPNLILLVLSISVNGDPVVTWKQIVTSISHVLWIQTSNPTIINWSIHFSLTPFSDSLMPSPNLAWILKTVLRMIFLASVLVPSNV